MQQEWLVCIHFWTHALGRADEDAVYLLTQPSLVYIRCVCICRVCVCICIYM